MLPLVCIYTYACYSGKFSTAGQGGMTFDSKIIAQKPEQKKQYLPVRLQFAGLFFYF